MNVSLGRGGVLGALAVILAMASAAPALATHNGDRHTPNMRVVDQEPFPYGTDLDFRGNLLLAGSGDWDGAYPTGIRLFNVGDPRDAKPLGFTNCDAWHSDVAFVGGSHAVQSYDRDAPEDGCSPGKGEQGMRVYDVTNRNQPRSIGFAETLHGSHNLTAVGDTGLVYNSSYNLANPAAPDGVSIVDVAADPKDPPVTFLEFPDVDNSPQYEDMRNDSGRVPASMGCHDIGVDMERELAFCAGISESQIWDISDPRDPVIISIIYNPGLSIHHGARTNADGDILILGDEWAGAAGGPTGCLFPNGTTGALWFYDISDPSDPKLKSYWSPPTPAPLDDFCTAHFYDAFDDRDWVVSSWYDHGLYVVDFSDPSSPKMVAQYDPQGATFWSAYAQRGAIYANSFAPATLESHDPSAADKGGLWVFELDGYSRRSK